MKREDALRLAFKAGLLTHGDRLDGYIRDGVFAKELQRFAELATAAETEARHSAQAEVERLKSEVSRIKGFEKQAGALLAERRELLARQVPTDEQCDAIAARLVPHNGQSKEWLRATIRRACGAAS